MSQTSKPNLYRRVFFPSRAGGYKVFMEYARVIGFALIIAMLFRSFVASPYKIPSSSMMPTLLVGDYLFVSKYSYGTHVPFTNISFGGEAPQRADVVVFKKELPMGGTQNYIKRVIAVPGDKIAFRDQSVFLNGTPLKTELSDTYNYHYHGEDISAQLIKEQLNGREYLTLVQNDEGQDVSAMRVPEGHYVLMGDNRDSSYDSRFWHHPSWGFVSMDAIVGRAEFIFWSWDENMMPRFGRIGTSLRAQEQTPEAPTEALVNQAGASHDG